MNTIMEIIISIWVYNGNVENCQRNNETKKDGNIKIN